MAFSWESLGDVEIGRENLGSEVPVLVYRLFEYSTKEVLVNRYGEEVAKDIIRECGQMAGVAFYDNVLKADGMSFGDFSATLQKKLSEYKIGILRVEDIDFDKNELMLTVGEDLDCSGMPVTDETVCNYDEGFIAGILQRFTGRTWQVREIDCWATGARVCRFKAEQEK